MRSKSVPGKIAIMSAAAAFCAVTLAMTSVSAHGPASPAPIPDHPSGKTAETLAELAYPDAPDGVDPMVTGPRTAAFKERQTRAGCSSAEWPDIPMECYPN